MAQPEHRRLSRASTAFVVAGLLLSVSQVAGAARDRKPAAEVRKMPPLTPAVIDDSLAIGGQELYRREDFTAEQIDLKFIRSNEIVYKQFDQPFQPNLSIVDVLMFNSKDAIKSMLANYDLI